MRNCIFPGQCPFPGNLIQFGSTHVKIEPAIIFTVQFIHMKCRRDRHITHQYKDRPTEIRHLHATSRKHFALKISVGCNATCSSTVLGERKAIAIQQGRPN